MTRRLFACAVVLALCLVASRPAAQTVYPTGTAIYDPDRSWNGFTVLSPLGTPAVLVIDMNGNEVKRWEDFNNSTGGPARVLPGGLVMAARGAQPPHQESLELIRRDFDGKDLWQFSRGEQIAAREGGMVWSARQHHAASAERQHAHHRRGRRPALRSHQGRHHRLGVHVSAVCRRRPESDECRVPGVSRAVRLDSPVAEAGRAARGTTAAR